MFVTHAHRRCVTYTHAKREKSCYGDRSKTFFGSKPTQTGFRGVDMNSDRKEKREEKKKRKIEAIAVALVMAQYETRYLAWLTEWDVRPMNVNVYIFQFHFDYFIKLWSSMTSGWMAGWIVSWLTLNGCLVFSLTTVIQSTQNTKNQHSNGTNVCYSLFSFFKRRSMLIAIFRTENLERTFWDIANSSMRRRRQRGTMFNEVLKYTIPNMTGICFVLRYFFFLGNIFIWKRTM